MKLKLNITKNKNPVKILATSEDIESNISNIRLRTPLEALQKETGLDIQFKSIYEISARDLDLCDIFILQRCTNQKSLNICKKLKSQKKFIIFEIDDLLHKMPSFLLLGKMPPAPEFPLVIDLCDLVSTTNARLGAKVTNGKKKFFISENYKFPNPPEQAKHGESFTPKASIIIAASDSILVDFIIPSLKLLVQKYGSAIDIVTIGHTSKAVQDAGIKSKAHPIVPHSEFMQLVSELHNPIGLLPLDNSEFSTCKSPVKYFDYSSVGVPSIASNTPPYNEVIEHGRTGFLVENTVEDWFEKVQALIDSTELRAQMGAAAMEHVSTNHSLEKNTRQWKEALSSITLSREARTIRTWRRFAWAMEDLARSLRVLNRRRLSVWRNVRGGLLHRRGGQ